MVIVVVQGQVSSNSCVPGGSQHIYCNVSHAYLSSLCPA